jgi:hypothetical protein
MREPEAGSLGKQKVGLLAVVSVEITSPHDWPAMVCDLFTDRRQLAPERRACICLRNTFPTMKATMS